MHLPDNFRSTSLAYEYAIGSFQTFGCLSKYNNLL